MPGGIPGPWRVNRPVGRRCRGGEAQGRAWRSPGCAERAAAGKARSDGNSWEGRIGRGVRSERGMGGEGGREGGREGEREGGAYAVQGKEPQHLVLESRQF
jgi:hypothetical protein